MRKPLILEEGRTKIRIYYNSRGEPDEVRIIQKEENKEVQYLGDITTRVTKSKIDVQT